MKEKVILKSLHPELYPDLVIECRVIPNDEIGAYLSTISDEHKCVAYKTGVVTAREGIEGEEIHTRLVTTIDGKEYILQEESNTVAVRNGQPDIVVTNVSSTSNEQYVVKRSKFDTTYEIGEEQGKIVYVPTYDPRVLTQVDEDVMIETTWGAKALCLRGSYIVTYNAEANDYNTLEQGAFNSTYTVQSSKKKIK